MANVRKFGPLLRTDGGLLIPAGAGAGKIATSDAEGNVSWKPGEPPWANITSFGAGVSSNTEASPARAALMFGIVFFGGLLKITSEIAVHGTLFSLPEALWPEHQRALVLGGIGSSPTYGISVSTLGTVQVEVPKIATTASPVSIDGLWFPKKG